VPLMPNTPRRPDPPVGLHLQVPRREISHASPIALGLRSPLSPKLDSRSPYGSPSVLPRHSRGMDFSRAVTNLHHSTLADQSSPDSSPALAQRAMMGSRRQSINSMLIDSPRFGAGDKRTGSGSVNMLGSEDSSSDDDIEPTEPDEHDPMLATPKMQRESPSLSMGGTTPASLWPNPFPQAGANFTGFRRARLREERGRHSSSSASGSNVASPAPASPSGLKGNDSNYFYREGGFRRPASRRDSISKVANELCISSGNDSGDEAGFPGLGTPSVIRRPVSRRGNMLVRLHGIHGSKLITQPKTRAFGRIRAELIEESMPVESEVRREAEVIRQVRESDVPLSSSPILMPQQGLEGIPENAAMSVDGSSNAKGLFAVFGRSPGVTADLTMTPPPTLATRGSMSSDDVMMESPTITQLSASLFQSVYPFHQDASLSENSRASTPQAGASQPPSQATPQRSIQQPQFQQPYPPSAAEGLRKANKRRRDDDLDMLSLKRRAVSPGVSVQNSPVLAQSPGGQRPVDLWGQQPSGGGGGQPKLSREGSIVSGRAASERSNSVSSVVASTPQLGPKRIGLQGMTDMQGLTEKMTIE
jgi:hypothetical protein